jgi:hypothetical protein
MVPLACAEDNEAIIQEHSRLELHLLVLERLVVQIQPARGCEPASLT